MSFFLGIRGNQFPISPLELQAFPNEVQREAAESSSEEWVQNCISAIKSFIFKPKSSAKVELKNVMSLQHEMTTSDMELILATIANFAKNAAFAKVQKENKSTDPDQKIATLQKKCQEELINAFASEFFESHPEVTYQGLLNHMFPFALKMEFLKIIAQKNPASLKWLHENISVLGIVKESDRFLIAEIIAQAEKTFQSAIKTISAFQIANPELQMKIFKMVISNNIGCLKNLKLVKDLSQQQLVELINYGVSCIPMCIFLLPQNIITDKQCMADLFLRIVQGAGYPARLFTSPRIFSSFDFPEEMQTLKVAFQMIMGPESSVFEEKRNFEVPIDEVLVKLQDYFYEKKLPIDLTFAGKYLNNKVLTQEEIQVTLYWLSWTLERFSKLVPEQIDWVIKQGLLEQIIAYRDPLMRYKYTETIIQVVSSLECRKHYENLTYNLAKHMHLPSLFLSQMHLLGVQVAPIAQKINSQRDFREAEKNKLLISTLIQIRDCADLSSQDKTNLLNKIFLSPNCFDDLYKTLTVLELNQTQLLLAENLTTLEEAQKSAFKIIVESLFEMTIPKENFDHYIELFSRNPSALLIYAAKIYSLRNGTEGKLALIDCLNKFFIGVLTGTFKEIRYDKSKNEHLQTVFPEDSTPHFEAWQKNHSMSLNQFLSSIFTDTFSTIDFEEIIRDNLNSILHLPAMEYVDRFLKESNKELRSNIDKELGLAITNVKNQKVRETPDQLQHLLFAQALIKLARQKIKLPEKNEQNNIEEEKKYKILRNRIIQQIDQIELLAQDIAPMWEFIEKLTNSIPKELESAQYKNWTITRTDDHQDLLLCGTEVIGSCQRINGSIAYNKCLLAYLLDGKNQLLAIKNENGVIKFRAILRVLWDDTMNKPILFMEEIYPENPPVKLAQTLQHFAVQEAKKLGLSLLTCNNFIDTTHPHGYSTPIISKGGPGPYEYVDALRGIQNNSKFSIPFAEIVYDHQN